MTARRKRPAPEVRKYAGLGGIITRRLVEPDAKGYTLEGAPDEPIGATAILQRVTATKPAFAVLGAAEQGSEPNQGPYWRSDIIAFGFEAVLDVSDEFFGMRDLDRTLKNNTLSEISNRISLAIRRRLLLATLESVQWNLTHAAERLRMSDPSAVLREIKNCELQKQHAAAKKRGDIVPGGRRYRAPDAKPPPK